MARNYYINGPCLVKVRGMVGTALDGSLAIPELGLTDNTGKVSIIPNYKHKDYKYDDFGGETPPDVMWMLTDVTIIMTLVHFDYAILQACMNESAGGGTEGTMAGAGKPMGAGVAMYANKNHYMSLYLSQPNNAGFTNPWRFKACYLYQRPVIWPVSAERSLVQCYWRAVPYTPIVGITEILSTGVKVWDHLADDAAF
jgi:hypothetical protein